MFLVDMVRRLVARERVCPVCGHRQAPRPGGVRTERCEKCGAEIPAKGGRSGSRTA